MENSLIINSFRFVLLISIQVFLLKNIGYYNLSIPFLYILFILLLPFGIPNWLLFSLAFITGITIDVFHDTLGLNALACSVMAFIRIIYINITVQRDGFDNEPEPSLGIMGFRWFILYVTILTFSHHLILFTFENFNFNEFGYTLLRVVMSTLFTVGLILISEFTFLKKKAR
jgi:rod shape-determining protein MreD